MIWFVSPAIAEDGETFFESEIRPVLANRCVACHGPDRKEGGRRLDSREAIGELAETGLLMKVIRGEAVAPVSCVLEQRLSEAFFRWISLGLPWPEKATVASPEDRADLARRHWAFQPVLYGPPRPIGALSCAAFPTPSPASRLRTRRFRNL